MKYQTLFAIFFYLFSCSNTESVENNQQIESKKEQPEKINELILKQILDSAEVEGSILIFDAQKNIYYSNDFEWAKVGRLPASTFKITNSIIALETGVVKNDSTFFKWDGKKRRLKSWERDFIFRDAFHASCLPCYQEIARSIGEKRMATYLSKLEYGDMKVDSSNLDLFWLVGDSNISQFGQIDFLKRFYYNKLPISKKTEKIMKRLMVIEENDEYKISGKTGWAIREGHNNGWFVGFVEKEMEVYFFATNIDPKEKFDMNLFSKIRKEITMNALNKMNIID